MGLNSALPRIGERGRVYARLVKRAVRRVRSKSLTHRDILFVCGEDDRGYDFNGKRYSQLTDSLSEQFQREGISVVTASLPFSRQPADQLFGDVIDLDVQLARAALADSASKILPSRPRTRRNTAAVWRQLLERIRPVAMIGIQPPAELCIAARQAGIWTADIQHGLVVGDPYYDRTRVASGGDSAWPDCVLCWDSASARIVEERLGSMVRARVIGNPWLLRFLAPSSEDVLVSQALTRYLPPRSTPGRPPVLVTLQWGLEVRPHYHPIGVPNALVDVMRDPIAGFDWWLRLHPLTAQPARKPAFVALLEKTFANRENVSWSFATAAPLPIVLDQAAAHVTSHSAATIEAEAMGVRTALLDERADVLAKYFSSQMESGFADVVAPSALSIREWLERNARCGARTRSPSPSLRSLSDFITTMHAFINRGGNAPGGLC